MLVFECPSCKAKMQAAEEHAGKTTACPECGAMTKIGSMAETPAPAPTADAISTIPMSLGQPGASPPHDAITTPDQARSPKKTSSGKSPEDDDDREDDRPRRRDGSSSGQAAAVGMGVGMILLLVLGIGGCMVVGVTAVLIALLVPAVQKVREAAARTSTMNNMKQIALAQHGHHDTFKFFPSPKMQPTQREMKPPALSWRVTLLPFVEQAPMFNQFDKHAAWDHPNNLQFLNSRPIVYQSLVQPEKDMTQTPFQYFTGPNTMFPDPLTKISVREILDGSSHTFLFAESANPAPWSKPADMAVTPNGALPLPTGRFIAAMGDGAVRLFDRNRTGDDTLRLLINPNDGQALPIGALD